MASCLWAVRGIVPTARQANVKFGSWLRCALESHRQPEAEPAVTRRPTLRGGRGAAWEFPETSGARLKRECDSQVHTVTPWD